MEYPALDIRFGPGPDADVVEARVYATLDDHQPIAIQEHDTADGWRAFFRAAADRDSAAGALRDLDVDLSVAAVEVPDEDWARRSQANLTAITVGGITVAPPWDVPAFGVPRGTRTGASDALCHDLHQQPNSIVIVIDPSMGFGTGHHQTTRLCLLLLQAADVAGSDVIDVGTGSGVLAIAAHRLGARSVVGIDTDGDALLNARENIARNEAAVELVQADLRSFASTPVDILTANLTGAVIVQHAWVLRRLVKPGGILIVSGFSPAELDDVIAALGSTIVRREIDGEWAAALLRT